MNKLNNKGITLVEIIVSVALISIVLIFLFSLLIQVNNENSDNEVKSSYLVNQATFTKQIQEDIFKYKFIGLQNSTVSKTNNTEDISHIYLPRWNEDNNFLKKITLEYTEGEYGHLILYKRTDGKTILSYYAKEFKQSTELEDFNWQVYNEKGLAPICKTYQYTQTRIVSSTTCEFPLVGPDNKEYSINISYIWVE